jgi:Carboxypeptidase regulatory-like domain
MNSLLAGLMCLLLSTVAFAQQTTVDADQIAALEGTVVDAITKEPVRKARVTLALSARERDFDLVATTDEAGHFRFAEVKPGTYTLIAAKGQFINGSYGETKLGGAPTLLKLSAGDRLKDLTLRLFPAGAISGRVLDTDGEPVPGEDVVLWSAHGRRGHSIYSTGDETTTNQNGEYQFQSLMPDNYYLRAGRPSSGGGVREIPVDSDGKITKVHDFLTFYPAAPSRADAQSIRVQSGQEQTGIDIHVQRGSLLTVKGRIAGAIDSISNLHVSASTDESLDWTSETAKVLPDGEFLIELPPGRHRLTLTQQSTNGAKEIGATEANLTDHDLSGIVITRFQPAQVRVRVVIEGEEDHPITTGSVSLIPAESNEKATRNSFSQFQPQNYTFLIDGVSPGKYHIWFNNAHGCYLKSIQSGNRTLDSDLVDVTEGANLNLLITYSKKVATVSGEVEVSADQADAPISVAFILEDYNGPQWNVHLAQLDQSHHFSLEELRPGRYLAFASQEEDAELWDNSDFVKLLETEGTQVELHESENATVHLKLIPKDVTTRIRQQLGI